MLHTSTVPNNSTVQKLAGLVTLSSLHSSPVHDSPASSTNTINELTQSSINNINTIYQQQIEYIQTKINSLNDYIKQYNKLIELLQLLPHRLNESILISLSTQSNLAYIPGKLIHTNEYKVNIGCGYYVEKTSYQTIEVLQRRISYINSKLIVLKDETNRIYDNIYIQSFISSINTNHQDDHQNLIRTGMKNNDNDDIIEIRETYDSDSDDGMNESVDPHKKTVVNTNTNNNTASSSTQTDVNNEFAALMARFDAAEQEEQNFTESNDTTFSQITQSNKENNSINDTMQTSVNEVKSNDIMSNDQFQSMWNNLQIPDESVSTSANTHTLVSTAQQSTTIQSIQSTKSNIFDHTTIHHPGDIARLIERRSPRHSNISNTSTTTTNTNSTTTIPLTSPKSSLSNKTINKISSSNINKKSVRFDSSADNQSKHNVNQPDVHNNHSISSTSAASVLPPSSQSETHSAFTGAIVEHSSNDTDTTQQSIHKPTPRISKFMQSRIKQ